MDWFFGNFSQVLWVVIPFVVILGVLVVIHEFGHFLSAKLSGVKVLTFAVGLGPWIFSRRWGETEYGIKAIPFGGYVKLLGEDPSDLEQELGPEDLKRTISAQPVWKKLIIFSAGSLMNIMLAFCLAPVVYWVGFEQNAIDVAEPRVGAIITGSPAEKAGIRTGDLVLKLNGKRIKTFQELITQEALNPDKEVEYEVLRGEQKLKFKVRLAKGEAEPIGFSGIFMPGMEPVVGEVRKGSPAEKAGIKAQDKIIEINSRKVFYWHELTQIIQNSKGEPLEILIERQGERLKVNVRPEYSEEAKRYLVGIVQDEAKVFVRYGFFKGLLAGFKDAVYWSGLTIRVLGKLFSRQLSHKALSGPVGIAALASQAAQLGFGTFVRLLVLISVNLGIINLFPFPPMDGAYILVTSLEGIIRRELSSRWKEAIFQTGFVLLIALMIIVTKNDILRYKEPIVDWFRQIFKGIVG